MRVEVDSHTGKTNAKIREHAMQKAPFLLVAGDKEAETNKVKNTEDMGTAEFVGKTKKLIVEKVPGL